MAATINGTPESAAWFREQLQALGETQSSFARLLKSFGDDREPSNILRGIQRMASGKFRIGGEMRVILTLLQERKAEQSRGKETVSPDA